ncbi:MAG: glycosyltransferase family 4 protein, partial [Pyrinomonadaceae bacterium]
GFIKQNKIEIVHAHLARDYPLAAIAVRLCKARVKLVLTRHVLFPINGLHKFMLPRGATFIAVSNAVRESLLARKIVAPNAIKLIHNGVDTRHFGSVKRSFNRALFLEKLRLPLNRRYVGIIGEITAHKGQSDFVCAAAMIAEKHSDVDFLIVGADSSREKTHKGELEKLVEELNLTRRVHFLGWHADVAPALCALDVFVSASRIEPFGLVIVEAMAVGLPIVATKSEGSQEILADGETAKIVPIKDAKAIANAVSEFLDNAEMSQNFGKKARDAARAKFDLARMTAETEKVYQEVWRND